MQSLIQDLQYGIRIIIKRPLVSLVAVMALAIGIGANTAIFSLIDRLLLRPLAFNNLDRLVMVWTDVPEVDSWIHVAPADFQDWQAQQQVFDSMVAYRWWEVNLTGTDEPERVQGFRVSSDFFRTLEADAMIGRTFAPDEAQPGNDRVVIVNERLWNRRFAADPGLVGKTIMLDGQTYTVIGIMAQDYEWPMSAELWTPLVFSPGEWANRTAESLMIMGRLRQDVSLAQAQAEMELVTGRLAEQYPDTNRGRGVSLVRMPGQRSNDIQRPFLIMLMGAVGFVLLIACANVANLQIARTTDRSRELAIREAMGAGQWRIRRQLLIESVMLSLFGGLAGLMIALWGIDIIKNAIPPDSAKYVPGLKLVGLDFRSLGFTFTVACLTGIISGLAPAFRSSKGDLNHVLKEGGRSNTVGSERRRLRSILVVGEIALALVLLVGTGLMMSGFEQQLVNQRQGFNPENVLSMRLSLPSARYEDLTQQATFYDRLLTQVEDLSMVRSAGLASFLPSTGDWINGSFDVEGQETLSQADRPRGDFVVASDAYFETLEIPMVQGRALSAQDDVDTRPVVVVSNQVVRRFWPNTNPIGQRIRLENTNEWRTVVGVVGDVKTFMFDEAPRMMLYLPHRQTSRGVISLVVRTEGDPLGAVSAIRTQIRRIDSDLPIYSVKLMTEIIEEHVSGIRLSVVLISLFGFMALLLAAIGVFSVMSYSVSQRTHEIGVRMAVGARPADVLKLIVGQGMRVALIGVAVGLILSFGLANALSSMMFGTLPTDSVTIIAIGIFLALVALAANVIPARRATRVDPIVTLRYE